MDVADEPMSIGEYLKRTRLSRRLELAQVSQELRIRTEYLEALEQDQWDRLPGEVYGIGFLRGYARYLEVDAEALVRYRRRLTGSAATPGTIEESPASPPPTIPRRSRNRAVRTSKSSRSAVRSSQPGSGRIVLGVAGVLAVLFGVGLWMLGHPHLPGFFGQGGTPSSSAERSSSTPPSSPAKKSTASQEAPQVSLVSNNAAAGDLVYHVSSGPLDLHLTFTGLCWVEVWKNNVSLSSLGTTYHAGQTASFSASSSLKIWTGTRAYTLTVDNQSISLPDPSQQVLHVTFQK